MNEQIQAKARAIAKHLPGWRYVGHEDSWIAELKSGTITDAAILMRDVYGRIEVYGHYPHKWRGYREERPRITMAMHREPNSLAKDVLRRFIPRYLPLYAKACDAVAKVEREEAIRQAALGEVAATLGTELRPYTGGYPEYPISTFRPYYTKARVQMSQGEVSVDVEIHRLPMALAKQVFAVVMGKDGDHVQSSVA